MTGGPFPLAAWNRYRPPGRRRPAPGRRDRRTRGGMPLGVRTPLGRTGREPVPWAEGRGWRGRRGRERLSKPRGIRRRGVHKPAGPCRKAGYRAMLRAIPRCVAAAGQKRIPARVPAAPAFSKRRYQNATAGFRGYPTVAPWQGDDRLVFNYSQRDWPAAHAGEKIFASGAALSPRGRTPPSDSAIPARAPARGGRGRRR